MSKIETILADIKELKLLEVAELVKMMEEEFGVSAAAGVAVAAGPVVAEEAEEQTEFDVVLTEVGAEKIKVIKIVRELTGLGLKEAKEVVESAPKAVKSGVGKADAEESKAKLEEVGAKVEIK